MTADSRSSSRSRWPRRLAFAGGGFVALLLAFVLISEWAGWPFLAGPMQLGLSEVLKRPVAFRASAGEADAAAAASAVTFADGEKAAGVEIHLLGGIDVRAARITIAAPEWSKGPPMLDAHSGHLKLRYSDLWRAWRGERLVVRLISADRLAVVLERESDGRASWQFGKKDKDKPERDSGLPRVDELLVADGRLKLDDAMLDSRIDARYSLLDGSGRVTRDAAAPAKPAASGSDGSANADTPPNGLQVKADGRYRSLPFKLDASSDGVLFLTEEDAAEAKAPIKVDATVGHAKFRFDGFVRGLAQLTEIDGKFAVAGRSLAAVGDVLGVTLPTTGAFNTEGSVAKRDDIWNVKVDSARIGESRLNAALRYDAGRETPLLEGKVGGPKLLLKDLGPVVGTTPEVDIAEPRRKASTAAPGRVLPAREFDLPSLRAMDANVALDFQQLNLNTPRLEPLQPMRAHLVLQDAVLTIKDIVAKTSSGSVTGTLRLDGRKDIALWKADLKWQDILLQQWLKLARADGAPPYISGTLDGQLDLAGRGRSTAEILGSLDGRMRTRVRNGTVSHLLVEGAGIDLAQALGVWIKGDESLRMSCALADMNVKNGLMRPDIFVIDTRDSIIWVDGSVSLVDESLDLRAVTSPKDFSLLSLRTPIHVKGTLGSPDISLATKPLAGKVIAAGLLSMLNPLAALIPLIDTGAADDKAEGCAALAARSAELRKQANRS
ncbi:AsmA family protein [Piscinibacter sakaiensis]|uniref:AsmA family protein n=1 Tax=Piscinibacter sakaiensis TaxID=1547922 RepID=UPI003AAD67B4